MATVGLATGGTWWGNEVYRATEELGFDEIWVGEHVLFWRPIFDAIPAMATIAAVTEHIKVASGILLASLRHPTVLAKELATIDVVSNGRLLVGLGTGGDYRSELEACGVAGTQGARLDEIVEILRLYWSQPTVDYDGRYYQLSGSGQLLPKPVRGANVPLVFGGRSTRALRRAALVGDGFLPYLFSPQRCADAFRTIRDIAEEADRALPKDFRYAALVYVSMAADRQTALDLAREDFTWRFGKDFGPDIAKYVVAGDPAQVRAQLSAYLDAGVSNLIMTPVGRGLVVEGGIAERSHNDLMVTTLEQYAREILPLVHGTRSN